MRIVMFHYNRLLNLKFVCTNLRAYAGMPIEIVVLDMSDNRDGLWELADQGLIDAVFAYKKTSSDPNDVHIFFLEWVPQNLCGNVGILGLDIVPREKDWAVQAQEVFHEHKFFAGHGRDNAYFTGPKRNIYAHPDCVFYETGLARSKKLVWNQKMPTWDPSMLGHSDLNMTLEEWTGGGYYDTGEQATRQLESLNLTITYHPLLFHAGDCTWQTQEETIKILSARMKDFGLVPLGVEEM